MCNHSIPDVILSIQGVKSIINVILIIPAVIKSIPGVIMSIAGVIMSISGVNRSIPSVLCALVRYGSQQPCGLAMLARSL